jgi:hypothetical protein
VGHTRYERLLAEGRHLDQPALVRLLDEHRNTPQPNAPSELRNEGLIE